MKSSQCLMSLDLGTLQILLNLKPKRTMRLCPTACVPAGFWEVMSSVVNSALLPPTKPPPGMVTHRVSRSRAHNYTDCLGCYLCYHRVGTAVTWEAMLAWGGRSGRTSLASPWLPKSLYPSRKQNVSSMKYFEASALYRAILQHKYKINGILSVVV